MCVYSSLLMSSLCSVCSRLVKKNQRKLTCKLCNNYVHKCCSDLTAKEFRSSEYSKYWHCASCNENLTIPFNHIINESEFQVTLFRYFDTGSLDNDNMKSHFENMKYNPFENEDVFEVNNYNNNSQYFYTDDLKESAGINNDNLTLLCSNIRSVNKNFDSFKELLSETDVRFPIIGLVETWFKDKPHDYYHLNGYSLESCNRINKKGGGVCLYVDEDISYNVRHDINELNKLKYTESLFVEIEKSKSQNIVVGIVYRPPDQVIRDFNKCIEKILQEITSKENKLLFLMGDFNINLLNNDVHEPTGEFVDILSSFSLYPSIVKPTRITSKSATLIDNIFTNNYANQTSGILLSDVSDHLPIFVSTNVSVYHKNDNPTSVESRDLSKQNIDVFKNKLSLVNWDDLCDNNDANVSYNMFIDKFNKLYDECIPKKVVKKRHAKNRCPKAPWITCSLLNCIRRKNRLHKKSMQKPTEANVSKYKNYRNRLNSLLRRAKQNYFSTQLDKEKRNMKNTWKILNSILRCPKKKCSQKFTINNKVYTEPTDVANKFNEYFANIGPTLASTIKHSGKDFDEYLGNSCNSTCFFNPTDEYEILTIIKDLGKGKSPGYDNVKSDMVKMVANEIVYPLKIIFNKSLSDGVVPDALKIAKVVPIYKKDSPEVLGNYRPVSVLPCFSKILERIVHERCCKFLDAKEILYTRQYGFRHKHSTYMAILDFINNANDAIDDNMFTAGIFMDLSKAFDTITHNILLHKLYHYGFRGISYNWFENYLTNRKQYVSYNGAHSSNKNVSCGVPQGSILGPLLFIVYMNDICKTSNLLSFILFADDTTVFYSDNDIKRLCAVMNEELIEVSNWFKANKLSLNAAKTNLMFIGTQHQLNNISDCNIFLDGCKLTRVQDAKFLGITLDENLTWRSHINTVCKICSRNIGVLNKLKLFLPKPALYQLYCTLILPYLSYGIVLWGTAYKTDLDRLVKLQKRAVRIISNSSYLSHTKPLFEKYNMLDINQLFSKEVRMFMYKYHNRLLPPSFNNMFVEMKSVHNYNTRGRENYRHDIHKLSSILTLGPRLWNSLPRNIKEAKCISMFKKSILKCV